MTSEDLVRIEIHVRDGGEERVFKQWRDGGVAVGGGNGDDARGEPPGGEDQRVLQFGRFRRLAALADDFAACAAGRLFTLIAKHGFEFSVSGADRAVGGRLKELWEPFAGRARGRLSTNKQNAIPARALRRGRDAFASCQVSASWKRRRGSRMTMR